MITWEKIFLYILRASGLFPKFPPDLWARKAKLSTKKNSLKKYKNNEKRNYCFSNNGKH